MKKDKESKMSGYKKIRYYLVTENIFIVLAFLLIAVGVYNLVDVGLGQWLPYTYICAGAILLVVGVTIAIKMIKAFQREDIAPPCAASTGITPLSVKHSASTAERRPRASTVPPPPSFAIP